MAELANVAQIGGTAQYSPITNTFGDQVALTQNQRNYAESKAKNDEQKKLAEDLANINALGLPKNIQADVQAKRDELIERVRNGEIDPYNYDFLAEAKGVAGYGAKVQNDYKNAITAAASEGQIIEQDESGNWVNRKQDYRNTILNPDLTVDDLYSASPKFGNMTAAVGVDDAAISNFVGKYEAMEADKNTMLFDGKYGKLDKQTILQMNPEELKKLYGAIDNMGGLGFVSKYADLNAKGLVEGKNFEDWKKSYVMGFLPGGKAEQDYIDNPEYTAEQAIKRTLASKTEKEEIDLTKVITPPAEYNFRDGDTKDQRKVLATSINLKNDVNLDYATTEGGRVTEQSVGGRPTKVSRMYYDPQTKQLYVGFYEYKKVDPNDNIQLGENTIVIKGPDGNKYYLDKDKEQRAPIEKNGINYNAIVSAIAGETKASADQVRSNLAGLEAEANKPKVGPISATVGGKKYEFRDNDTVQVAGRSYTFKQLESMYASINETNPTLEAAKKFIEAEKYVGAGNKTETNNSSGGVMSEF